ncbi:7TM diverse intracellular signaling domain-containing protein [Bernardetia sp. ABR2-2B]|uniref:7TM diverse intracellular signaling domain-containing protein n=1 Tax=Bernardetia sp. ABR2-2B TaxID=3127472 RepID=UPI0030CAD241
MLRNILCLFLFFACFSFSLQAQELQISYFVDSLHQYNNVEEIDDLKFIESTDKLLNFANTNDAIWVRLETPSIAEDKVLEIANPLIDTLDVYRKAENKFVKKRYGSHLPFDQRDYDNRMFLFDVEDNEVMYIRFSGKFPLELPIYLSDRKQIDKKQITYNFFFGIYFGILFALFMYNLFLVFNVKDKAYTYYLGYIVFVGLFYAMLTGFAHRFLYSNTPSLNYYLVFAVSLALFFIIEFCSQYLKLKEHSIKNYWILKFFASSCIIVAILDIFLDKAFLNAISQVMSLVISIYLIALGFYCLIVEKQKQAFIYVIAWTGYLTGIALLILQVNGALTPNFFTQNAIFIGSAAEVILFSIALAMRINQYRKEKAIAQKNELKQLKINQDLIKEQKEELEQKVEERTVALKETVEELHQINEELETSLQVITTQNDKITHMHDGVTASINYAKRIQEALLPFDNRMSESLKNYFVLYIPRDIVSGDFYWFSDLGDKIIAIQSDCTGHGVPGAFMSVIGINVLEEIVNARNITNPSEILLEVDNLIRYSLNQSENQGQDGMDMSVVCLYKNERKIELAGAMNSVYLIEDNEIKRIKGDKFSIGGWRNTKQKIFTTHTIIPKDTIYVYQTTDGYQDQFGGIKNKKFGSKRLERTFFEIHAKPMKEQQEFLKETITDWMLEGKESQIDDISIFALEY